MEGEGRDPSRVPSLEQGWDWWKGFRPHRVVTASPPCRNLAASKLAFQALAKRTFLVSPHCGTLLARHCAREFVVDAELSAQGTSRRSVTRSGGKQKVSSHNSASNSGPASYKLSFGADETAGVLLSKVRQFSRRTYGNGLVQKAHLLVCRACRWSLTIAALVNARAGAPPLLDSRGCFATI